MKVYISILIIFISCILAKGENTKEQADFVPFQYDQELSSGSITSICQDTTGQIWLTTQENLYRFDGYRVDKITLPANPSITVQTEIQFIFSDSRNNIWLGTGSCIYQYDQNHKTFTPYFPEPDDPLNMSNVIYQIAEAPSGDLYFATRNGIFRLNESNHLLEHLKSFPWHKVCSGDKKDERIALSIHITPAGILWAGTQGDGAWRINLKDEKSIHFRHDPNDPLSLGGNWINTLYEDEFGIIWLGTENGFSAFQKETSTFINGSPEKTPIRILSICENENGDLLLGGPKGLYTYQRKNKDIQKIKLNTHPGFSSFSNEISVLKKDRSGGIWIGTKKGLARCYPPHDFTLLKHSGQDNTSLFSNQIYALTGDSASNQLWITYSQGAIDRYQPGKGILKHYPLKEFGKQYTLPLTAYLTPDREFILATQGGLLHFNPAKDCFETLKFPFSNRRFPNTYAILKDRQGLYWLGILDEGVFRIDTGQQTCQRIPISYEKIHKNIYTNIKKIYEDRQGYLWIVFWRAGVLRYNPKNGKEQLFTRENTNGLLPNNTIWEIKEDYRDNILFATAGGIGVYNLPQEKFIDEPFLAPLQDESIVGLEGHRKDTIWWLTTTRGILRLDPVNSNVIRYTEADGLQSNVFNTRATAQLDSLFFFGGDYGLNIINTQSPITNHYIPHPQLTRLIINGTEKDPDLLTLKNGQPYLKLKKEDIVEIFFSSFSYIKEWRNYYKHSFSPRDSIWQQAAGQSNNINFTATHSGTFPFVLAASNSDGKWSKPHTLLFIEVANPYLIPTLIAILLLALSGTLYYYRKTIRRSFKKKRITKAKTKSPSQPDTQMLQMQEKFRTLMDTEQLYLNRRFSKTELAGRLKLNEQQLTLFLKNSYGKSFPELINHYRVEAVKQKMEDPTTKDYTLFALGEECGFNSRSSFYRVFKEYTGLTPAEYQEKLKQKG